ncbi:MAG: tryptophan--tRNA ligase [Puniceicoccales bacterium]|jgi:tryptophanyl-tRNA synthetase|nr:tryptophan--tRNA ligase [Puniceicoccales bacterium]
MEIGTKKVVLTGMQPTGILQLGNFLGAANNWRKMLDRYNCYFFIPNQHAITVPQVPADLRRATLNAIAQYIACGLDPERCTIFVQSHITGHTELAWILGCITPIGQLYRMHQFKEKSAKKENIYSGLLYYPVLMAADILLYNADYVPTGEDQRQHVELARDLAEKFNATYSETFTVPAPLIEETGARIMSLKSPEHKMSKSDPDANATIYILDEPKIIQKKIASAVTDSGDKIADDPERPGIRNLLHIYCAAAGIGLAEGEEKFAHYQGYAPFKRELADMLIALLEPVREKYRAIKDDKTYLLSVVRKGAETVQPIAHKLLSTAYRKVGFLEG